MTFVIVRQTVVIVIVIVIFVLGLFGRLAIGFAWRPRSTR